MHYYFAPLEGITGYLYRNTHHAFFPGTDKYFMPFAAPNYTRNFKRKEKADMAPANNTGICVVPQILSNNASETLWAIDQMLELGYREINLNLGCPMPTVAKKRKGSGFLKFMSDLDAYLDEVYNGIASRGCLLSVKTRLGTDTTSEAEGLITIYNRYPISELIIHPRCQRDLYRGKPDREAFLLALSMSTNPVVYNGDLCTAEDVAAAQDLWGLRGLRDSVGAAEELRGLRDSVGAADSKACSASDIRDELRGDRSDGSGIDTVMIGRGLLANPALVRQCQGGPAITSAELRDFHAALYAGYQKILPGTTVLLNHMKELWFYMGQLYIGQKNLSSAGSSEAVKLLKQIRKASTKAQYEAAVNILIGNCPMIG